MLVEKIKEAVRAQQDFVEAKERLHACRVAIVDLCLAENVLGKRFVDGANLIEMVLKDQGSGLKPVITVTPMEEKVEPIDPAS